MEPPINEIEQAAADWAAKIGGGAVPADQQRAFEAWLDADPRHLGAYLKIEAVLAKVSRLGGAAEERRRAATVLDLGAVRLRRSRFVMAGAIAASLMLVIGCGIYWQTNTFDAAYETRLGEMKAVPLPDGSKLTLNTETKAHVHYTLLSREVVLDRGEALFDVAKHKPRPFIVRSGDFSVRAVGTSFAVESINEQPFTVTVREGVVSVSDARKSGSVALPAGQRAEAGSGGNWIIGAAQLAHDFAWLTGRVFFRNQPLSSAVREFGRYSALQIVIDDPALARRTVTGAYVATDPAGFARAVAVFMDLQLEMNGSKIYLRQKKL